ncbi:MAG: DotU family type IV/VI secretion system protein [Edaphobacter sp.]
MKRNAAPENSVLLMQFRQFASELIRLQQVVEQKYPPGGRANAPVGDTAPMPTPAIADAVVEEIVPNSSTANRESSEESESEKIRQSLLGILGQQSVRVQELGGTYGYGLYREAEYVMAALADEIMLNAQWSGRAHWQLLEEELFHSHASGDLFFRKLDRLLSGDTNSSAELAMIFFQALALDFRGKYRGNDPNKSIERYRRRLYNHIYQQAPEDLPQHPLFPQNYQIEVDDEVGRRLPSPHMWWLVLGGVVTVWLVASTLLWQQISGSMQRHIRSAEKYSLSTPGDRP